MARLLADEDFSRRVIDELRKLGHDVVTALEAGLANRGADDALILAEAIRDARVVLTFYRRDFVRLHLAGANHAGMIVCTRDPDVARQARRIHYAISAHESLAGLLIRVTRPGPAETQP